MTTPVSSPASIRLSAAWPEIQIAYEDSELMALNKPAGLLVAPIGGTSRGRTWPGFCRRRSGEAPWVLQRGSSIWPMRIASICIPAASCCMPRPATPWFTWRASSTIANRRRPTWRWSSVNRTARASSWTGRWVRIRQAGLTAVDPPREAGPHAFHASRTFRHYSLLRRSPNRPLHQIRAHLKAIGLPLVADADYGNGLPLLLSTLKRNYKMKPEGERR